MGEAMPRNIIYLTDWRGLLLMKKRVMHIVQSAGGVERYILMLLKNMDSSKYENILVCSNDYKEENYNGLVYAFECINMIRPINIVSDFKAIIYIRSIIKKYKPNIVYMHSSKGGAIGRIANIGIKNNSIYNPHGWSFNMDCDTKKKALYRWTERFLSRLCNMIIAISDYEKKTAIENKICSPDKIRVIYNGTDIDEYIRKKEIYSLTRADLGIENDAYIIGTVGRLSKQKAPDTFIKAAGIIKKYIPRAFFLMVGDGEMKNEIEDLIRKMDLQKSVLVTGWVNEPMEYIRLFDQAMLLSRWEGFGLVLAEYMLAKKPIIATKVDAISDLITDKENGFLVKMDDVEAIARASKEIYEDKELVNFMITNSFRLVNERFNIKRVVSELETLFNNK
jgi:glycosyltransferase involved in cell wall biosynthesis